ncbi:MAG TPA: three-Cys-motif partner protein TcmP [Stellaceae bacterium]|nr:three-Cys-motif partner protein TcmP [Stellaceae bacterium]
MTETIQKFGGPWSLIKTDVVAAYLQAFSTALKQKHFRRVYIDAFAGSGTFTFDQDAAPLLDIHEVNTAHSGSAARALAIQPPFDELIFIEQQPENVLALQKLIQGRPDAQIVPGDANRELLHICDRRLWRPRKRRGVIFLDPFGLSVQWSTLETIAKTEALDLWYLFSISGLYRNVPIDINQLSQDKREAITRALGVENWIETFYEKQPSGQMSLFGQEPGPKTRTLSVDGMEGFVHRRLETIFPFVARPKRLSGPTNAPLFSLFFAVSNPDRRAIELAKKIAEHILKMV